MTLAVTEELAWMTERRSSLISSRSIDPRHQRAIGTVTSLRRSAGEALSSRTLQASSTSSEESGVRLLHRRHNQGSVQIEIHGHRRIADRARTASRLPKWQGRALSDGTPVSWATPAPGSSGRSPRCARLRNAAWLPASHGSREASQRAAARGSTRRVAGGRSSRAAPR